MNANKKLFLAKPILDALRHECGDSDFGYRIQGLFAHVLIRLGFRIDAINATGHPDIAGSANGIPLLVQVKSLLHSGSHTLFQMTPRELEGITPLGGIGRGCLAVLDCAVPISWVSIAHDHPVLKEDRPIHVATLRAAWTEQFSRECTDEFAEMIVSTADRLSNLTYPLLCSRALSRRGL